MGEFILLAAQAESESKGIKAEGIVRRGNIRKEIINLSLETNANYVVLGKPKSKTLEENVFTHEHLDSFGQRIEEESGAKIILVSQ